MPPPSCPGSVEMHSTYPNDSDASTLAGRYRNDDPFPEIEPALLNHEDIAAYASAIGLISPFDPTLLKAACYPFCVEGTLLYTEDGRKWSEREMAEGDLFKLKQNALVFLTVGPTLRLPAYIAARFNLRIVHVYRGLIAGTGPLVDPGWCGRLSLPLHNLSSVEYVLRGGEPLIWMEFTKLSRRPSPRTHQFRGGGWLRDRPRRVSVGPPRMDDSFHKNGAVKDYVRVAAPSPIRSSIGRALYETSENARHAKKSAKWARNVTFTTAIVLFLGFFTLVAGALEWEYQLHNGTDAALRGDSQRISALENRVKNLEAKLGTAPRSSGVAVPSPSPAP